MSLFRPTISNEFNKSDMDELRWVIHIRQTLEEELDEEDDHGQLPVSIFNVPTSLMTSDPDAYVPKQIAIGPYHCWRPDLRDTERLKLAATKRLQNTLQIRINLEHLVDQLRKYENNIRACYHKYLNFNGETLVWMMIIDASFLLEFLQEGRVIDYGGRKLLGLNETLRDILMLENQIPLFVLRNVLDFKLSSSSIESADDMLYAMLLRFFKEVSPFKTIQENYSDIIQASQCAHLLDFLYNMIVPKLEEQANNNDMIDFDEEHNGDMEGNEKSFVRYVKQALSDFWRMASKLTESSISFIHKILLYKPMKIIICLPFTMICNLPMVGVIKHPLEYLFFSQENEQPKPEIVDPSNVPPLVEEITIPCVMELSNSGICFSPANNGGIQSIRFDAEATTLHLPIITIDINTQVLLRNLVAYETSISCGPLVFTRYIEFMNGIIDSEEDVKILREKGIVLNHLKSNEQVVNLWNGMSRSINLTKVPFLDKVIEDVNKYYNGRISIKAWRFVKLYVFGSWQFLTFLVVVLIFLLTFFQAFCSFYGCNHRN